MATYHFNTWRVVLLSESHGYDKMYDMSPSTTLEELLQTWRNEFKLLGHWIFMSADGHLEYEDDQLTFSDIGETVPSSGMITLRVKLSDEPPQPRVFDIFVFVDGNCHRLKVKPSDILRRVLPCVCGRKTSFECNGRPLFLNNTVKQAGLKNKFVIYESKLKVSVKLSNGDQKIISMPTESLICHLKSKIAKFEAFDFSLKCCGRILHPNENVKNLQRSVEVSTTTFVVYINGQRITWKTATGELKFTDFVFQLSQESQIDSASLERAGYCCIGCGRTAWKSEEDFQVIQTPCCREQSLTLVAKEWRCKQNMATEAKPLAEDSVTQTELLKVDDQTIQVMPQAYNMQLQRAIVTEDISSQTDEFNVVAVKLLVFHYNFFVKANAPRPEIEEKGEYQWKGIPHTKCCIDLWVSNDGWVEFDVIRNALTPYFTGSKIDVIYQWRGVTGIREVALVTSLANDEVQEEQKKRNKQEEWIFCDKDGWEFLWPELKPKKQRIARQQKILICGGGRRTVIEVG